MNCNMVISDLESELALEVGYFIVQLREMELW